MPDEWTMNEIDRLMNIIYQRNDRISELLSSIRQRDEWLVELRKKYDTVVLEKQYIVSEIARLNKLCELDDHTLF